MINITTKELYDEDIIDDNAIDIIQNNDKNDDFGR